MRYVAIGLIVLVFIGIWGYQKFAAAPAGAPTAAAGGKPGAPGGGGMPPMPVEAEVIKADRVAQEIIAVGSLRSNESVVLSSEIAGRIAEIPFREGQPVAKGTLLFE